MRCFARLGLISLAAGVGCQPEASPPLPSLEECSSARDRSRDCDGDGYTPLQGDCNDLNAWIHPGAPDGCGDFTDNDCDGVVDNGCVDDDQDGYAIQATGDVPGGDCNDFDPSVSPEAIDIPNHIDDDCDGTIDRPAPPCPVNPADPIALQYAGALGLCGRRLIAAELVGEPDPRSHALRKRFGAANTTAGPGFVVLSSGVVADENDAAFGPPSPGTAFTNLHENPVPLVAPLACDPGVDDRTVRDYVELKLTFRVPSNASGFGLRYNFFSAEYPENVGAGYDDGFVAVRTRDQGDAKLPSDWPRDVPERAVRVATAHFDECDSATTCGGAAHNLCASSADALDGTGYELSDGMGRRIGGATGWQELEWIDLPGDRVMLRIAVFDGGDRLNDSTVVLRGFWWNTATCVCT